MSYIDNSKALASRLTATGTMMTVPRASCLDALLCAAQPPFGLKALINYTLCKNEHDWKGFSAQHNFPSTAYPVCLDMSDCFIIVLFYNGRTSHFLVLLRHERRCDVGKTQNTAQRWTRQASRQQRCAFYIFHETISSSSSDAWLFITSFCCLSWWNVYLYILRCAVRVGKFTGLRHAQLACGILIKALIQQPARGEVTGASN